jgi:hypothetical protein
MELRLRTARTTKDIDISLPAEMVDAFDGGVVKRVQQSAPNRIGRFFYFRYWRVAIGFECCSTRWSTLSGRCLNRGPGLHQVPSGRRDRRCRRASDGVDKGKKLARLCRHPLPRHDSSNSRVKDLVDMVLLARLRTMDKSLLQQAISATFSLRGTHPIPVNLPAPPGFWTVPFLVLARECQLELTLSDALKILTECVSA